MLICSILSPYLSGPWSRTECNNDHVLVVCDHVDGGIRHSCFILPGFITSKNADLLYFGGPWTDYQCHSEKLVTSTLSVRSTVTRPRPMRLS